MGHYMFHHCVFNHVLHKVCFLKKKNNKRKTTLLHITTAVNSDFNSTRHAFPTHRGVCSAAHAAAVGLCVFDGVSRNMDLQRGRVRIGTVTVGTFEGLVFVVLPLVRLEQRQQKSFSQLIIDQVRQAMTEVEKPVMKKPLMFTCRFDS